MKAIATLLLLTPAPLALAWDIPGHKVVASIAWETVKPATRQWISSKLTSFHVSGEGPVHYTDLVSASALADDYKHPPLGSHIRKATWSTWHFWDFDVRKQDGTLAHWPKVATDGTVAYGIVSTYAALKGKPGPTTSMGDAWNIAMLTHFVGDIHQPLHCAERDGDRGGNGFEVRLRNAKINLHSLWDHAVSNAFLLKRASADADYTAAARTIIARHPIAGYSRQALSLKPLNWAKESYELAINSAYEGTESEQRVSDDYVTRWQKVGEERVVLAGYRLAKALDALATRARHNP